MYNDKEIRQFEHLGIRRPEHTSHGVNADDLGDRLRKLKPYSWRLEGNKLIGQTDMGTLVQTIPSDRILTGTDNEGMPIFARVTLQ